MKKWLSSFIIFFFVLFLTGCSCTRKTAKSAVEDFLDQYKNLSASVLTDLERVIEGESFDDKQQEKYREILKKQYSDIRYEIIDETYEDDTATVETKITVYDLYKAQSDAATYLNSHMDEFKNENGTYDNNAYLNYKLDEMKKMTDTVEYKIFFQCEKQENGQWKVQELEQTDLEKIHGIYNYDTSKE